MLTRSTSTPGTTAHQRERIARRGDFLELVGPEVRRRPRRLGVDHRRPAAHGHGFGNRRDLQLDGQIGRNADRNDDIIPYRGREALEREAHLVLAGREIQEAEFACLDRRPHPWSGHCRRL